MKIILVANNLKSKSRTSHLSKYLENDDKIDRFNIGLMNSRDHTDFILFRKTSKGYLGFNKNFKIRNKNILRPGIKYILIDANKKWIKKIQRVHPEIKKYNIIKSGKLRDKYGWNPSSGLVAIDYFRKLYPKYKIYLYNFT